MIIKPIGFLKILCIIVVASISLLFFSELSFADKNREQIVQSDNISIRCDKVEKTESYPKDIIEKYFSWPSSAKPPVPSQGNTFIFIYLTITRIENIHLVGTGGRNDKTSLLFDEQGRKHKRTDEFTVGIKYKDNKDITSPYELVEGSKITLVFQASKDTKPTDLKFVYYFKKKWEDPKKQAEILLKMSSNK
jgi:hypothetical protein